ncbi:MAG: SMI1/KNR4 family protein [Apibacter sp.]|nr:SMI1/KNR4 family protein [Apibacter sp.]
MNKNEYIHMIDSFISFLEKKGISVLGCNVEQIAQLEKKYGKLPKFYKLYLEKLGCYAGDFKAGTWILYSELDDINEETIELMHQNKIIPPKNMFAFLMHQGYTSLFFTNRDIDDPKVYCYTECEDIDDINKTFSLCLEADINEYLKYA